MATECANCTVTQTCLQRCATKFPPPPPLPLWLSKRSHLTKASGILGRATVERRGRSQAITRTALNTEDLSLPCHSHHGHHLCRAPHAHFYIHIATTTAMLEYITLDAASLKSVSTGENSRNVIEKDGAKRRRRT